MADSSFGVSSNEVSVVKIIPTTRNPTIWSNYDLCELSNGLERARCKNCGGFFKKESNSTLKTHLEKSCPSLKNIPGEGQASMISEGGIWNFDPNIVRDRMTKLVIQRGLTFNHFDNPLVTRMIQEALQPRYHQDFDILAWWKGNESTFPVLSAMARDLLTVQAFTVASESVFSLSGRVLSIRRTRLTPAAMEMCICLKDHLDAVDRRQDRSSLEDEIEVEEFIHESEVNQGLASPLTNEELAEDYRLRGSTSNSENDGEN
ncbi:hypothetical protein L1987_60839 [Smallanthus sonchifolius]|uniref:Uncharacterized protein n=1 Tax=Smallanthus sonchifolius TaxID=185202 RepID=A0ACB9D9H9_9ASTR|nr:hypothetical protein L1987_60839 [Smallanthus sonchifolius]